MSLTDRTDAPRAEPACADATTGDPHHEDHDLVRPPVAAPQPTRRRVVLVVAAAAGVLAAVGGPSPTGGTIVDALLVAVSVAVVVVLGSAALRWDAALAALLAGVLSWTPAGFLLGLTAAVAGFVPRVEPGRRRIVSALLVAVAMNLAARSRLELVLGASTIGAVALAAYVAGVGLQRLGGPTRRIAKLAAGACVTVGAVATAAFLVLGLLAADDLREANELAEDGLVLLGDGDIDAAAESFAAAAAAFESANERVGSPLVFPARLVPGVAQHHRAVTELSTEAGATSRLLVDELARVDLGSLTLKDGTIDVDAVRALQEPLRTIRLRIDQLDTSLAELESPWLVPPVAERLGRVRDEVAAQLERSDDALAAAIEAPGLLGADGPRRYFVAFTTPAEARGIGGFMGNWAEITLTDGVVEMTAFGRTDDLNEAGDEERRIRADDAGLTEWVARYGAYNIASGPDGTTGPEVWKNVNMSPDMTATGRAIADLYPQSGGSEIDGVLVLDVYTLARLLEWTGPIPLPDGRTIDGRGTVSADDAADFLLNDQYDVTRTSERVDVLEEFSERVVEELLSGPLPAPTELLDTLGPMVDQGRFAAWASRPSEQALFERIGLAGTFEPAGDGDGLAIVFNNAVGNKIDYYLAADAAYVVDADGATNTVDATLDLRITNNAPTNGEPDYVIGNPVGLPTATNRTFVSIFTRLPVTDVTIDGKRIDAEPGYESGYFVTSVFVVVPSGEHRDLTLTMGGPLDVADAYDLIVRTPPAVAPVPVSIDASWTGASGTERHVAHRQVDPGRARVRLDDGSVDHAE